MAKKHRNRNKGKDVEGESRGRIHRSVQRAGRTGDKTSQENNRDRRRQRNRGWGSGNDDDDGNGNRVGW